MRPVQAPALTQAGIERRHLSPWRFKASGNGCPACKSSASAAVTRRNRPRPISRAMALSPRVRGSPRGPCRRFPRSM